MKFWKRAAAVMVAITLCMGIPAYFPAQLTTPLSVQAADTLQYENLTYQVTSAENITITGCDASAEAVTIPAEIDGKPVARIGERAFFCAKNLTSVTMENGVKLLETQCFYGCERLDHVVIPDSVTGIEAMAFYGCLSLENLTIPTSVREIGYEAFTKTPWFDKKAAKNPLVTVNRVLLDGKGCTGKVVIPDFVACVGGYAFFSNIKITEVVLPKNLTRIAVGAFYDAAALTKITIPATVKAIDKRAFGACTSLTDLFFAGTREQWEAISMGDEAVPDTITVHTADEVMKGDFDGDGTVSISDAYQTLLVYADISAGGEADLTQMQFWAADVDADNSITIADAYTILLYYAEHTAGNPISWEELLHN